MPRVRKTACKDDCLQCAYLAEDLVEFHDVDDPGAQTGCCLRLGANEFRVELLVVEVRLDGSLTHLGNVLFVIVDQRR